jgi:tetratricopeptide (TPR) repeat protein
VAALAQKGTPLSVALVAAEKIPDVHSRIFAYTEIAKGYAATGDIDNSVMLLDRIIKLTDISKLTQDSADIESSVADVFVKAGQTARAVALLQNALVNARYVKDDTNRGIVLEKIISACFDAGPAAYDVLRQTIQAVYIIQDLWVRASVLIDTARRYQESGSAQPVNVLLQQAIPAAGSIGSPWLKALALSDIAVRFQSLDNGDSADYYASRALDQITSVRVVRRSEEDASRVLQVSQNLARLHMVNQAIQVLQTVEYTYLRAQGFAQIAETLHAQDPVANLGRALDLCSRAVDLAQGIPDDFQRAEALATIAQAYGLLGQPRLALATVAVAQSELTKIANTAQRAAAVRSVAQVELQWGSTPRALGLVSEVQDAYSRASTMIHLVEFLLARNDTSAARNAATLAEEYTARTTYLRDNLYRGIALARIRLGEFSLALADVSLMKDPYPIATTLAELGASLKPDSLLAVSAGDTLRSIAASLLSSEPVTRPEQHAPASKPAPANNQEEATTGEQGL